MFYPKLQQPPQVREMNARFLGLNRNVRGMEGEFSDMKNLTATDYPVMAVRRPRGVVTQLTDPQGMLAKDSLAYVDGGKLCYGGHEVAGITLSTLEEMCPKILVGMGAYLVVFPDKVYVNTADLTDVGSLENQRKAAGEDGGVSYKLCRQDGTVYENYALGSAPPEDPLDGRLWLDTGGERHGLKQYSGGSETWVEIPTVYIRVEAPQIGKGFARYDGVTVSGCVGTEVSPEMGEQLAALNGSAVLQAVGEDYLVVTGILDRAYTQSTGTVTVSRRTPDMDFVTECGNRLWGCKYGMVDGKTVNEIYACALGDFKNWNRFLGTSADSYAASRGSDGGWTGAVTHLGCPLFFKENCVEKVYPSPTGAHQIQVTNCRGVQKGSHGSLAVVNEILYYKSAVDVCAYDGSLPRSVSAALGDLRGSDAVAGALGDKYYLSLRDREGNWEMLVFDTGKGLWHREDETRAQCFARVDTELFFIDGEGRLVAATGQAGEPEAAVEWMAETVPIGFAQPDNKYVSRINLRLHLEPGASVRVRVCYDSGEEWEDKGGISGCGKVRSVTFPILPRRCDHMKLRLEGRGGCRLYSLAKILEEGSDVFWDN